MKTFVLFHYKTEVYPSYVIKQSCVTQGLTLGVKGLQVRTTFYDTRLDSGSERVTS